MWGTNWGWHWAGDGMLHLFRGDSEVLRGYVRATAEAPGVGWLVVALERPARTTAETAEAELREALKAAATLRKTLRAVPRSGVDAAAAAALPVPAPPYEPSLVAESLSRRLPCAASALHLGEVVVPLPRDLQALAAVPDGTATLVTFSDGARLWLCSANASVDPIGLTAVVGGALLWPGSAWPLPVPVAAWGLTTLGSRSVHRLRSRTGEELDVAHFRGAGEVGLSNVGLDLPVHEK